MSKRRTVPVQDLGIKSIPTPDEVFEYFQTKGRYPHDSTEEEVAIALPKYESQQHGPTKVYTPEEVAEYNRQRDWIEELDDAD